MKIHVFHPSKLADYSHVVSALNRRGQDAALAAETALPARGDVVLVMGGDWWATPVAEQFLRMVGDRGAIRILWQLEPLLPPVESPAGQRTIARLLATAATDGLSKRGHSLRDMILCQRLTWQCRSEPWSHAIISGHVFKYPLQQTRCLIAFWRNGLIDHCMVTLEPRQRLLRSVGIPSRFLPFGNVPHFGRVLGEQARDIDVLFLGRLSTRRRLLVRQISKSLGRAGFNFKVVTGSYGEERTQLLNRTKILVNIHKYPWEFPGMRLLMGMSCGTLIVSEPAPNTQPYKDGQHLVLSAPSQLPQTLIALLRDDARRHSIAEQAHEFATRDMPLGKDLVAAVSDAVGEHRGRL